MQSLSIKSGTLEVLNKYLLLAYMTAYKDQERLRITEGTLTEQRNRGEKNIV
jgi:hypothetical protein